MICGFGWGRYGGVYGLWLMSVRVKAWCRSVEQKRWTCGWEKSKEREKKKFRKDNREQVEKTSIEWLLSVGKFSDLKKINIGHHTNFGDKFVIILSQLLCRHFSSKKNISFVPLYHQIFCLISKLLWSFHCSYENSPTAWTHGVLIIWCFLKFLKIVGVWLQ